MDQNLTQQLLELMQLDNIDDLWFKAKSRPLFGARTYGGLLLAQALLAAYKTSDRPAHSLQAYFLRAGNAHEDILYQVSILREGKTFLTRRVDALQNGSIIFTAMVSFAYPEDGLTFQYDMPQYPLPEQLISEHEHRLNILHQIPKSLRNIFSQAFHIDIRPIDFVNPISPQVANSKYAEFLKTYHPIPKTIDTLALHQAIIAYYSDYSLMNSALRPHGISYLTEQFSTASLDHTLYFHQPFRADQWMLYEMDTNVTAHARGLNIGQMWQNNQLVCTTIQENLMRYTE